MLTEEEQFDNKIIWPCFIVKPTNYCKLNPIHQIEEPVLFDNLYDFTIVIFKTKCIISSNFIYVISQIFSNITTTKIPPKATTLSFPVDKKIEIKDFLSAAKKLFDVKELDILQLDQTKETLYKDFEKTIHEFINARPKIS